MEAENKKVNIPQTQERPGFEEEMKQKPVSEKSEQESTNKLKDRVALITGGDSGIGKGVALLFAKEGADIAIIYLSETEDAEETKQRIEKEYGKKCLLILGDIADEKFCEQSVQKVIDAYGRIDILINNAATQYDAKELTDIKTENMLKTFQTNIFSMFWITKNALPYMKKGSAIVNTTSVTAYRGSPHLMDYAATKGAIVAFTRSLAGNLVKKEIRVNAVAPGPIWTPLITSSFSKEQVAEFGSDSPMGRPGQPAEVAPCYLFLASGDASYMTGQVLHPNGGEIING
ncbi:MAG TPA: SDR family oxidoreductase [Chitinophagaceae bacterium]|nr:SDR family oxidoreductase [Chitinophagaceae bacterium]